MYARLILCGGREVFAKLKHLPPKVAAPTVEAVIAAIGRPLGTYTLQKCPPISAKQDIDKPVNLPSLLEIYDLSGFTTNFAIPARARRHRSPHREERNSRKTGHCGKGV